MALGLRKLMLGTVAASCLAFPASAANCVAHSEREAFELRVVQTELMVAALSCGESDRYNQFVTAFKGDLAGAYQGVRRAFGRIYRGRAKSELNAFNTQLANASSQRGNKNKARFCQNASYVFDNTLGKSSQDMVAFVRAQPLGDLHGYSSCSAKPLVTMAKLKERDGATTHPLLFGTEHKQRQFVAVEKIAQAPAPEAQQAADNGEGEEESGMVGRLFGGGGGDDAPARPVRGGGAP